MPQETEPKKAGFLEEKASKFLLWLEENIEDKQTLAGRQRRQFAHQATAWTIKVGLPLLLTADAILSYKMWEKYKQQQQIQKLENLYNSQWQKQSDVTLAIRQVKENQDLETLELNQDNIRFYSQDNIMFYQTSNIAILAIDKKALSEWTKQNNKPEKTVGLVFNDNLTSNMVVPGNANFNLQLDTNLLQNTHGTTKQELKNSFTVYLSSISATVIELVHQYGSSNKVAQILANSANYAERVQFQNRLISYQDQFGHGKLTPFIKVAAINPSWFSQKGIDH